MVFEIVLLADRPTIEVHLKYMSGIQGITLLLINQLIEQVGRFII